MFGIYYADKTGKFLICRMTDEDEANKLITHLEEQLTLVYELMGRNDFEDAFGEKAGYSVEELKCAACGKVVSVSDYGVQSGTKVSHVKNICRKCVERIDNICTIWEE